ncbi:3-isopropylmalate dehydratase small subunit [Haloquadratum walsbyi]|jgi:3-isopropylmalate dehydratase, small subunit (EC 4.2.1.33)|uniref:3-isopropylmalate dehydratase n=1 Tax=Haloquadratum walsbyi J07HQW2 TaxID=1238425 RepID=U1ND93_9EURY|nr:3-isopropylmalate dehydratase small subunit [Haloquadratum walsbyi]ERG94910.1 MAG: 3-isopropylmalate dehydratase, small subunit [Haloquadratum walsbyi J07HQW2]
MSVHDTMEIRRVAGTGVPVRGNDVDTDQIMPARFMKEVTFDNMGEYVFYDARRDDSGDLNDHPLNEYKGASILIVNKNFGCGSSREHAPQGLMRWGIRGVIGESFAEIFADNCKSLGIPAMTTDQETINHLQSFVESDPGAGLEMDVKDSTVIYDGKEVAVEIDSAMQEALIDGIWDTTAVMHSNMDRVRDAVNELPYVEDR